MTKRISILLFISVFCCAHTPAAALFFAEAEVEPGPQVSRITVSIVNNSDLALELHTGSRGGPGQYDDRVAGTIIGWPVTALPELTFKTSNHWTTVRAPMLGSSVTFRSMEPHIFVVPANSRRVYYSFEVPSLHIQGEFLKGEIVFPEANEIRPRFNRGTKELTVAIVRCSKKQSEKREPEQAVGGDSVKAADGLH